MGFDYDGTSHLYQTDPSGTYHEWKANAIGRNANSVREFLEKNYSDETTANSDSACVKLCVRALLEVVQSGSKNVEIAVARRNKPLEVISSLFFVVVVGVVTLNCKINGKMLLLKMLKAEEVEKIMAEIEKENEAEAEKKSQKKL